MAVVADMPEANARPVQGGRVCRCHPAHHRHPAVLQAPHRACHPPRQPGPSRRRHGWGCSCGSTRSPCGSSGRCQCPVQRAGAAAVQFRGTRAREGSAGRTDTTPGEAWAKVVLMLMGTDTAPVTASGSCPTWITLVPKPAVAKSWVWLAAAAMLSEAGGVAKRHGGKASEQGAGTVGMTQAIRKCCSFNSAPSHPPPSAQPASGNTSPCSTAGARSPLSGSHAACAASQRTCTNGRGPGRQLLPRRQTHLPTRTRNRRLSWCVVRKLVQRSPPATSHVPAPRPPRLSPGRRRGQCQRG